MHVTVIADASLCPDTDAGGYGFWIACERGKVPGSGVLHGRNGNSINAEMKAICEALYSGLNQQLIQPRDIVLMQTDCLGAIDMLLKPTDGRIPFRETYDCFHKLVRDNHLFVNFRHVKGHVKRKDFRYTEARYATNRACDARAKEAMRQARDAKRKQK